MQVAVGVCVVFTEGEVKDEPIETPDAEFSDECTFDLDDDVEMKSERYDFVHDEGSADDVDMATDTIEDDKEKGTRDRDVSVADAEKAEDKEVTPSGTSSKCRKIVEDIQETIGSALKGDELSPKHLLEIMQKMFELQKSSSGKKDDGGGTETLGGRHINPFSEEFNPKPSNGRKLKRRRSEKGDDGLMQKNRKAYERCWNDFVSFINSPERDEEGADGGDTTAAASRGQKGIAEEPTVDDYLKYLTHLKEKRQLKASSVVTVFSRLNSLHQKKFKKSPQQIFPSLHAFVKGLEMDSTSNPRRKFSKEQIQV